MKTKLYLIATILIIVLILIFVWQNSTPVTLKLWFWETQITLSFVILASLLIGALIYKLITIPAQYKKDEAINKHQEELEILKENVKKLEKEGYKTRKKLMQTEKMNKKKKE